MQELHAEEKELRKQLQEIREEKEQLIENWGRETNKRKRKIYELFTRK